MTEVNDTHGLGFTPETLKKMEDASSDFGKLLVGLTGPQISLVFASCLTSWLAVHTVSAEQATAVLDFVFDKTKEGLQEADKNGLTAWGNPWPDDVEKAKH